MHEINMFSAEIQDAILYAENQLLDIFKHFEEIEYFNQWKVLRAFQDEGIAQRHFAGTTGYGYDDIGRDSLERVFAKIFKAEDALVRPQIANGTHAIYLALSGLLRFGDTMLSITGKPYDTLDQAISKSENQTLGSLADFGVHYREIPLEQSKINIKALEHCLVEDDSIKLVYMQRSRGYAWREAVSIDELKAVCSLVRNIKKDVYIVVDNCYGEFCQCQEPIEAGADIIAGSLIKNPGGGIALTGGYIAGKKLAVERIAHRMTVPGTGREVGSYASGYLPYYQGIFMAPHITVQSLKSAALFARVLENEGMVTMPSSEASRSDIIQALRFSSKSALITFCQSIQKAAPIDSFVTPEPWEMPGYAHEVIMAAGTFIQGASIELSADAPICEPYTAYIQGALTYAHGRIGAMFALDALRRNKV